MNSTKETSHAIDDSRASDSRALTQFLAGSGLLAAGIFIGFNASDSLALAQAESLRSRLASCEATVIDRAAQVEKFYQEYRNAKH